MAGFHFSAGQSVYLSFPKADRPTGAERPTVAVGSPENRSPGLVGGGGGRVDLSASLARFEVAASGAREFKVRAASGRL